MNSPSFSRFYSLDVFRGITMFLLMAEAAMVYHALADYYPKGFGHQVIQQFHHHPWHGLRFWDLIQPFFMFIVGVAMPFSLQSRLKKGKSWSESFRHILYRCMMLFLFGVGLHCVYNGRIVWELWNVLTQLSFTILVTFLLMRFSWKSQLVGAVTFLLLTELIYRLYDPASPFVKDANVGSWIDMILMGKINDGGGWVTINFLPTAAHTIWGALCGQLFLSNKQNSDKLKLLLMGGALALLIGYGLDLANITPIVKRIATTSFVFTSGGWAILTLAFFYWLTDMKGIKNWTKFFAIVGMNSIFIYLFGETIGVQWLGGFGRVFTYSFFGALGLDELSMAVINGFFVLAMMWGLCYFLFKKGVFFKI